jgi:hypothetical protein
MGGVEEIVRADLVDGLLKIGDDVDVSVGVFRTVTFLIR